MGRPLKADGERASDIAPTGIRLPVELREALVREAQINGRTLSGEIVQRLRESLELEHVSTTVRSGDEGSGQPLTSAQTKPITDAQRVLLKLFDQMGPEKQLALITVLKR